MKLAAARSILTAVMILSHGLAGCTRPSAQPGTAGSDTCERCHEEEARFVAYGAHRTVECERCHGPGAEHARAGDGPRRPMSLGDVALCLSCHRRGADPSGNVTSTIGSFEDHLRTLERAHRIKLDRRKSGTDCVGCHDPHLLE